MKILGNNYLFDNRFELLITESHFLLANKDIKINEVGICK